ncbi:MAG: hypothetical protein K0R57_6167 [Paenibacillaceae bacterium]|jgi:hypothetical protein|nr:hypothetical protein [Paenibacillaceae bacterium]
MKYNSRFAKSLTLAAAGALLLAGCGRTLPAIDAETLSGKKAVLVLAGNSLTEEESDLIRRVSKEKAGSEKISMEFVVKTSTNTEDFSSTINRYPYDGIIAVGSEWKTPVLELARQNPDARFLLLLNGLDSGNLPEEAPANIHLKRLDPAKITGLWNDWVELQQASGLNIMWISRTDSPVPSAWVPSEEADRLLELDIYPGDTWLPQLTYQINASKAGRIALYTPVDEAVLTRIRSLKLPVTDLNTDLAVQYNWAAILAGSFEQSISDQWQGGQAYYSTGESIISRK